MNNELKIVRSCKIDPKKAYVDNEVIFENISSNKRAFLKQIYRSIKPGYAKFFKMDNISKLAFLAAEMLLKDYDLSCYEPEEMAIILSNSDSTLDTDTEHQKMIEDYDSFFPSPSVFVYTLPNIMIGEISIRHGMRGENAFFIVEKFTPELIVDHINSLFLKSKSKLFIGGWVNYFNDTFEAFLYLASVDGRSHHDQNEILKLYKTT